ncbi:hydrolase, partial [Streptomyces sp. 7R007]
PRRIIWFGAKEQRPYTLSVLRSGVSPLPVEGTYVQRGFLPRWLATFFGVFLALAITFVMLWIAYKPSIASGATESVAEAGSTLAPSPSATSSAPLPPAPTQSTTPPAADTATGAAAGASGGGGGGATATVTAKPKAETAATAVNRLAKDDPGGRHVCYRAFVQGKGWQKPVCDGTVSGTVGQGRPIKALNVAVYGVQGSAGNAMVYNPDSTNGQGTWKPNWTPIVADGKDNYIGGTKQDTPYFVTFVWNVGSGQACNMVKISGLDWKAQSCNNARPDLNTAGDFDNSRFIEAIKLTV